MAKQLRLTSLPNLAKPKTSVGKYLFTTKDIHHLWFGITRFWVTTAREDGRELFAICVDLESGDILHDIKVFDVAEPQLEHGDLNSHASPTPIVEEDRIYVHYGTYGTACLDTKTGEKLWERRDLNCDHRVRPASSPIIDEETLFLTFDGVDVQFIAALDKSTGDTLWLQHRKVDSNFEDVLKAKGVKDIEETKKEKPNDNRKSYATPTIITFQGKKAVGESRSGSHDLIQPENRR